MAGHDDGHADMGGMYPQIGDQRLAKALDREFRRGISSVRHRRSDRRPKPIDTAGVDDVTLVRLLEHGQEGAGVEINPSPADIEDAFPFIAGVGDDTAAAADSGIVEQQVDLVGLLLRHDRVPETQDLRLV